jgi:hypothetical protein
MLSARRDSLTSNDATARLHARRRKSRFSPARAQTFTACLRKCSDCNTARHRVHGPFRSTECLTASLVFSRAVGGKGARFEEGLEHINFLRHFVQA